LAIILEDQRMAALPNTEQPAEPGSQIASTRASYLRTPQRNVLRSQPWRNIGLRVLDRKLQCGEGDGNDRPDRFSKA